MSETYEINSADAEYLGVCDDILRRGRRKPNRTGVDTIGIFGASMSFNLAEGFPALTTKKLAWKAVVHELLWFLSGDGNINRLVQEGVNIWNDDGYKYYLREHVETGETPLTKEEWIEECKTNPLYFGGYLGFGIYGTAWRSYPHVKIIPDGPDGYEYVDQIKKLLHTLKTNPDDRRMIVNAWHPALVDAIALPPCHMMFQCHTEILTVEERLHLHRPDSRIFVPAEDYDTVMVELDILGIPRRRLNLAMYQRSCDMFLGVPFNIASYALLTHLLAHECNMIPGTFTHFLGDAHIYVNHIDAVKQQMSARQHKAPRLWLNAEKREMLKFTPNDIRLEDYVCEAQIKAPLNT